jgi:DNA-binding transcriptional LysR family regulator
VAEFTADRARRIIEDEIIAVDDLLVGGATLEELAALPLIHLDAPDKRWTTWASWFAELGYTGKLRRGIKVNNYMIALQAAQDDAGLVLGWHHLVSPLLQSGALISLNAFSIPAPTSFFLSQSQHHWITAQATPANE